MTGVRRNIARAGLTTPSETTGRHVLWYGFFCSSRPGRGLAQPPVDPENRVTGDTGAKGALHDQVLFPSPGHRSRSYRHRSRFLPATFSVQVEFLQSHLTGMLCPDHNHIIVQTFKLNSLRCG